MTWEPYIAPTPAPSPGGRGGGGGGDGRSTGRIVVAVVVAGLLLVGVGAGAVLALNLTAPSKSEYASKADAICSPGNGSVNDIASPTNYPELTTASSTLADTTNEQVNLLRKLKLPSGSAGTEAKAFLASMAATGTAAQGLEDSASPKNDVATANSARELNGAFGTASNQAKTFGFASCAVGMQSGVNSVTGGSKSIIKSSFVAKADSICRAAARKGDAIEPRNESLAEYTRAFNESVAVVTTMQSELEALPVPPGDESQVSEMWAAQSKAIEKLKELRDAFVARNESRATAVDLELGPLITASDAKLDAYGLGVCGTNFGV
ncbi:MAG: hypothetical protein ACRD12_02180 [Acidimicrobiales bacterium]